MTKIIGPPVHLDITQVNLQGQGHESKFTVTWEKCC